MKNYGAKLQPIPGHVIKTHQSRGPGLAAVMAVGSGIIIIIFFFFFLPNAVAKRGSITGGAAFVLSKRGVNSGEGKKRESDRSPCVLCGRRASASRPSDTHKQKSISGSFFFLLGGTG